MPDEAAQNISRGTHSDESVIELAGVRKTFARGKSVVTALDDVSFTVRGGCVTGLIGPDAAGKTTLMRLATGLLTPDSGRITVGKSTKKIPSGLCLYFYKSAIQTGYLPQ